MRINYEKWSLRKKYFWRRVWEDYEIGYLDRDLIPLIVLLNMDRDVYTTSSCSGRIVVVDGVVPWIREEASVVFKSHTPATLSDVDFMYRTAPHKSYWLVVTGPILHFSTTSIKKAVGLLKKARTAGFKHSGIIHTSSTRGVFVELVTGIYMTQMIKTRELSIVSQRDIEEVLNIFNKALIEGKQRLQRLYEVFKSSLPENVDLEIERELSSKRVEIATRKPIEVFYEICGDTCRSL
jgi:tRNA wybutosine-synthesizing protein 3